MEKVYEISLRLSSPCSSAAMFNAVQGDTGTRKIQATIQNDDGTAFTPGTGVTAEYWECKADKTGTQHDASISGNVVTVVLTEQDLAAAGRTNGAIVLKQGDDILSAMPFWFNVIPIPTGKNFKSSNDYQIITEAVAAAEHAPAIRSSDLHWMVWDMETGDYVDTGVPASGVDGSVLYSVTQTLTDAQQRRAQANIGAASDADLRAGTEETAGLHLGFYIDEDGDICQAE